MCIKDYETNIGGQGPVRAVELLEKKEAQNQRYLKPAGFYHRSVYIHVVFMQVRFIVISFFLPT
jgi:hypothetical protein